MKTIILLTSGLLIAPALFAAGTPEQAKIGADAPWENRGVSDSAGTPIPVAAPVQAANTAACVKAGACSKDITRSPDGKPWGDLYFAGFLKMKNQNAHTIVPWLFGKGQNLRDETLYAQPKGVRDPLHARASVLTVGGKTWGLVEIDAVGISYNDVQKIRAKLKGEGFDLVTVAATHNHEGPDTLGFWGPIHVDGFASSFEQFLSGRPVMHLQDGKNKKFMDNLVDQSAAALREAKRTSQSASIYLGETPAPTVDGKSLFVDDREPNVFDQLIHIFQTRDQNGKAIATLANVAMHPVVLGQNVTRISADVSGSIARHLEQRFGGVGIHVNGPIEAINASALYGTDDKNLSHDAELREKALEKIGEVVGQTTLQDLARRLPAPVAGMAIVTRKIFIPLDNFAFRAFAHTEIFNRPLYTNGREASDGQDLMTELNLVILKDAQGKPLAELFTVPGEMAPEILLGGMLSAERASNPGAPDVPVLKDHLRSSHQYLIGLGNDELGYIVPLNDYVYPKASVGAPNASKDRLGRSHYHETLSAGTQMATIIPYNLIGMLEEAYEGRTEWTPETIARKARQDALKTFAAQETAVPALVQLYLHQPEDEVTEGARQALLKMAAGGRGSVDVPAELRRVEIAAKDYDARRSILRLEKEVDAIANPPAPESTEGKFPSM